MKLKSKRINRKSIQLNCKSQMLKDNNKLFLSNFDTWIPMKKKILGYLLMKWNYKQLSPYLLHNHELGFDVEPVEINKTKLN